MRKVVAGLALAAIAALGLSTTAGATPPPAPPYPPNEVLVPSDSSVEPGDTFSAQFFDCLLGETVRFTFVDQSVDAPCLGGGGGTARPAAGAARTVATATFRAPASDGVYPLTAVGLTSGRTSTAFITVGDEPAAGSGGGTGGGTGTGSGTGAGAGADDLPNTGSDSAPIVQIGAGVLLAGVALLGVAFYRRRSAAAA